MFYNIRSGFLSTKAWPRRLNSSCEDQGTLEALERYNNRSQAIVEFANSLKILLSVLYD